jgi:PilZ domain
MPYRSGMATDRISNISFRGSVEVEQRPRSRRVAIGRSGTLRERDKFATDVVIEDVSETGCMFRSDMALTVGTLLSIGIPGTGMHAARISRVDGDAVGCSFLLPINAEDIASAQIVETVADGDFRRMREQVREAEVDRMNRRATDRGARPSKGILATVRSVMRFRRGNRSD